MLYLGKSHLIDYVFCVGLGVASTCVLVTVLIIANQTKKAVGNPLLRSAATWGSFLFGFFGMSAIAVALGETRAARDANSILGFALAVGMGLALFFQCINRRG